MAVRKPRVGEERRRCSEMVFVELRWARTSGRESWLMSVRDRPGGSVLGSVRRVSVSQAMRSRTQRTEPARALITSGRLLLGILGIVHGIATYLGHRAVIAFRWDFAD